jgi:hypothetical protein
MSAETNTAAASPRKPLTFAEAAPVFNRSESWMRGQAQRGAFQTVLWGRARAIPASEVDRLMAEGIGALRRLKGAA